MESPVIPYADLPPGCTELVDFFEQPISVTSAPEGAMMDIYDELKRPEDFHGSTVVHDLVQFGPAFERLIGTHDSYVGIFSDRDRLPDRGIYILSDHLVEAGHLVDQVDALAQRVIADNRLYSDTGFCREYLALARAGFSLVAKYVQDGHNGIPITLERAGVVTTRLAAGVELDAIIPNEVSVVTKRAHHRLGYPEDLMVSVKWRNLDDVEKINNRVVEIADFVNPASGASTLALLVAARRRGATPSDVIHKSFMATEQGIEFTRILLLGTETCQINPVFYTLGTSRHLSPQYYLERPAVADAGDVLCNFLPASYQP